jgi:hypothetical protein
VKCFASALLPETNFNRFRTHNESSSCVHIFAITASPNSLHLGKAAIGFRRSAFSFCFVCPVADG